MIWTGQPGQLATAYVLLLVPGGLWYSVSIGLEAQGVSSGLAVVLATGLTLAWLAISLTPAVRRMVIRCIFPDERPGREFDPDGGHDLARVRDVLWR